MTDNSPDLSERVSQALEQMWDEADSNPDAQEAATEPTDTATVTDDVNTEQETSEETQEAPEAAEQPEAKQEEESSEESFTKLDLKSLDPALVPYYKSMQADYTRKTQEVKPLRDVLETHGEALTNMLDGLELGTPAEMADFAINQFIEIHTNPEKAIAFFQYMGEELAAQGLLQEPGAQPQAEAPQGEGQEIDTSQLSNKELAELRERQQALEAYLSQQEQARREAEQQAQQEALLEQTAQEYVENFTAVQESPEFKDFDEETWELVRDLGLQSEGNFLQVAKQIKTQLDNRLKKYITQKQQQPRIGSGDGTPARTPNTPPQSLEEMQRLAEEKMEQLYSE